MPTELEAELNVLSEIKTDSVSYFKTGVLRFDSRPATGVVRTDEGYLDIEAPIGAVGVVTYRDPSTGKTHSEFRPPEELFRQDSIDTAKMKPVTDGHPVKVGGILSPATVSKFSIGNVGENIRQDGDLLVARFIVQNGTAIKKIEDGQREISPGYHCDLEDAPGEWQGQKYDFIQRNIKYNHIASVPRARGGRKLSIRMDGDEQYSQEDSLMATLKLDSGIEYECPTEVAVAFAKQSANLDAANAELTETKKANAELKVNLDAAQKVDFSGEITSRVALASQVKALVGDKVNLDSYDPLVLKSAAIVHRFPKLNLDGKGEDYINAMFDTVVNLDAELKEALANNAIGQVEGNQKNRPALAPATPGAIEPDGDEGDSRKKMIAEQYNGKAKSKAKLEKEKE